MVELTAHLAIGRDPFGPRHRHRVAGTTEVAGHQLGVVKRRTARPRPARVVHVVGLRRTQCIQAAQSIERRQLFLDRARDVVLCQQFTDAALLTLGTGTVVAEDVEHQCVVGLAEPLQLVEDAADLGVDMLQEPGEHLHEPTLKGALSFGDVVPALHCVGASGQLGLRRYPAGFLLPGEDPFPVGVPAVVELARVLVGPRLEDVVRSVHSATGPVHEERLVGCIRFVLAQPGDRVVGEILGQVVAVAHRRLDRVAVLV